MANGLTQKQEIYVQELIKGNSQREAYKIAYPKSRYWADNTLDARASRLLKSYKVYARYNELKAKVIKYLEDNSIITTSEIIKEIVSIAKDDISNYLEYKTVKVVVGYEDNGSPLTEYRNVVELKDSKDIDTKNVSEISISQNGTLKVKLYGRDTALYKLADIFGLNETQIAKQKLAEDKFAEEKNINKLKFW